MLKTTHVSGRNEFLKSLDPAFAAHDLVDDRFAKMLSPAWEACRPLACPIPLSVKSSFRHSLPWGSFSLPGSRHEKPCSHSFKYPAGAQPGRTVPSYCAMGDGSPFAQTEHLRRAFAYTQGNLREPLRARRSKPVDQAHAEIGRAP